MYAQWLTRKLEPVTICISISGTPLNLSDVSVVERKRVNHGTTRVGAIVGGLGGLLPALSAMRLRPLEALR